LYSLESAFPDISIIINEINAVAAKNISDVHHQIIEVISSMLAHVFVITISFLTILILVYLFIKFIGKALDFLVGKSMLMPFNRVLGMLLGTARGLLMVFIISAFLMPIKFLKAISEKDDILTAINESYFISLFFDVITKIDWNMWEAVGTLF